jgi:hypothetical protein
MFPKNVGKARDCQNGSILCLFRNPVTNADPTALHTVPLPHGGSPQGKCPSGDLINYHDISTESHRKLEGKG